MAHEGNHEVWRDKAASFVGKHDTVCIAVIDDSNVAFLLDDKLLELHYVCGYERVWVMPGECAVYCIEYVGNVSACLFHYILYYKSCHSI